MADILVDIAVSVASKVAEYLVAPVGRQCGYVIFTDSRVRQLNDEVKNLGDTRDEVQRSINQARNQLKPIKAEVETWLKKVEAGTNKARNMLENDGRAEKTCFYGWLPNPMARYRLGNEASDVVKEIKDLIDQGQFKRVYNENPPPGLVDSAPDMNSSAGDGVDTITDSRASIFQGIMKALDDEKDKVIGVYGPGGVGKTTLLEEVEKKLRKERRPFHMIVKAKVSQTPDLTKIQDDIAYALSLNNLKDEPSEAGRRDLLFKRLQKDPSEKVLIILDDLWAELDLKAVGIPSGDVSGKCKLLLASRYKDVVEQKMRADRTFFLEGLSNDEAFRLFEKTVGDRLKDEEQLKVIAAQVVKKLAGLPLLIISVASTLKNSGVSAWKNALKKINVKKMETIVKLSYDHLENEDAKSLFLLCGLIGGTIKVELLLGLGMGLGLFEGFNYTIEDSRDRLNTTLDELHSACLLLDGGDDKDNVTIHDLYSEIVVSTPFRGHNSLIMNSNYGSWSKDKLEKCWAICLVNVGNDRLAEIMLGRFPHLKILVLSKQNCMEDCSRMDFTYMKELRALCLRSMPIPSLPSSIGILENLRSLYLNHCYVEDIAILGKLKALWILSFARSTIFRLPKEIGELSNLRSLNLSECYVLQIVEPGALKGLINLEELHMKGSFDEWMGKHEIPSESCGVGLAELKSLTKLTSLEISIRHPMILLEDGDLPFGNLVTFWINIGDAKLMRKSKGLTTMELNLEGCDGILSRDWVQKALQKTQCLYLRELSEFKKSAHELCTQGFQELKHLHIDDSPSIKYIANSSDAFMKLESLRLENLINLEKIYHGPIARECFSKLKAVTVKRCGRLKNLWRLSDMQRFVQLEKIEVQECDSMQFIVTHDAREEIVSADNIIELPNVRRLVLRQLPNMTSFCVGAEITSEHTPIQCRNFGAFIRSPTSVKKQLDEMAEKNDESPQPLFNEMVTFPNIRELEIEDVQCKELWNNQIPTDSFCKLESLVLKKCDNLRRIAPSHMWKRLQRCLEILQVISCRSIEIVYEGDGTDTESGKLRRLVLRDLENLRHIWRSDGLSNVPFPNLTEVVPEEEGCRSKEEVMRFPSLEYLSISQCRIFGAFIRSPTSVKRQLDEMAEKNNESPQPLFNEMVTFPNIRELEIEDVQCKELWNNQIPTDSFCKLESLVLKKCDNLRRIAPSHMWKRLQCCLKILQVISCRLIEIVYEGDGMNIENSKLRRLVLRDLENLRHIWRSDGLPNVPFPNLRDVEAVRCSRLEMLFATFTAKFLGHIEKLMVESCEDMELIADHEKRGGATGTRITFSELTVLRLFELPKFRGFLPEEYSLEFPYSEDFPSLRRLSVVRCGSEGDRGIIVDDWAFHLKHLRALELVASLPNIE